MNINWPDKDREFVFSKNAKDLFIYNNHPVSIQVGFGEISHQMTLDPMSGEIRIDMKSLLGALVEESPFSLTGTGSIIEHPHVLYLQFRDTTDGTTSSISGISVIPGGVADPDFFQDLSSSFFWTWRPQKQKTYPDGKEYLSCYYSIKGRPGAAQPTSYPQLFADVYLSDGTSRTVKLFSTSIVGAGYFAVTFDCSVDKISAAVGSLPDRVTVSAYDLYFVTVPILDNPTKEKAKRDAQRFIVSKQDLDMNCFVFRNTLSAFDSVYSFGKVTESMEQERKTIVSHGVEREVYCNTVEKFQVRTGYISSKDSADMWADFLKSSERYIVSGGKLKAVIIDEIESERTKGILSSLTFTYHLADPEPGRSREKNILTPYNYDEQ